MERFVVLVVVVAGSGLLAANSSPAPNPPIEKGYYSLADFGPVGTAEEAQLTFEKAIEALGKTGGLLVIPRGLAQYVRTENTTQCTVRTPPLPALTKSWQDGPGITIVELGDRNVTLRVPPLAGLQISRILRMPEGDCLPHWSTNPIFTIESKLVYGSVSYLDWLQEPVEKGNDRRFYVPTIRGIRPGQFLNLHGGPGYGGGVVRGYVKSLGYDREKNMHYFVADTDIDHKMGAIVHNKNNVGLIHMLQTSNNDNQTYDVKVIRRQYAHGDTYVYYCDFDYMSNIHSAAGDENGTCYAAFTRTMGNNFRATVESVDWAKRELKFAAPGANVETLGDSRPLINRNEKKWITAGKVMIVPPESFWDTVDTGKYPFQGKTYPTTLVKDRASGAQAIRMGGLIRGDRDCPWTHDIVGRFFAITEKSETVPDENRNLRWYEITSLKTNADGTKDIEIRRYWWGARSMGSPTLYCRDNYSWDGHLRPLSYAIAPGTYVNDVSKAIPGGRGGQRILGLAPYTDQGTAFDFQPGDPVEQAIGPDPFKPRIFRCWMWENVPGAWPASVLDFANFGATARYAAMSIAGGGSTLEDVAQRQEKKPAWENVIMIESATNVGINCKGDFADAAILFQQPSHEQPIKWHYGQEKGRPPKEATLTVSRTTGAFTLKGGGLCIAGGISASDTPARNLRGKNVEVNEAATTLTVTFETPEADADYAVFLEQSWLSNRAVSEKTATGFTVQFDKPAPKGARLDWMIVR